VASGILPDVEGGILPPGPKTQSMFMGCFQIQGNGRQISIGPEARLYVRQDA